MQTEIELVLKNGWTLPDGTKMSVVNPWVAADLLIPRYIENGHFPKEVVPVILASKDPTHDRVKIAGKDGAVEKFIKEKWDFHVIRNENAYHNVLRLRLIPFCQKHNPPIIYVDELESRPTCSEFINSWKWLKPKGKVRVKEVGYELSFKTRVLLRERFESFLNWCIAQDCASQHWLRKNVVTTKTQGNVTLGIPVLPRPGEKVEPRYGLSDGEFERLMKVPNPFKTLGVPRAPVKEFGVGFQGGEDPGMFKEVQAAMLLMRWTGMPPVDCANFDSSKLKQLENGQWCADYIRVKTEHEPRRIALGLPPIRCIVYVPPFIKKLLDELEGWYSTEPDGTEIKHYFFELRTPLQLGRKITIIGRKAQAGENQFQHKFMPYSLRHTFVTWLIMKGTPTFVISLAIGHTTTARTERSYAHVFEDLKKANITRLKADTDPMIKKYLATMKAAESGELGDVEMPTVEPVARRTSQLPAAEPDITPAARPLELTPELRRQIYLEERARLDEENRLLRPKVAARKARNKALRVARLAKAGPQPRSVTADEVKRHCGICNVVGHDKRAHRIQTEKRPFTKAELRVLGN